MSCTACKEPLSTDYVQCTSEDACKYHFGNCAGIQEKSWGKGDLSNWKCQKCRIPPRQNETQTTAAEMQGTMVSAEELRSFMSKVAETLKPVENLNQLKETVKDMKEAVEFLSSKYDDVMAKLKELEGVKMQHEEKIHKLENELGSKDKVISDLSLRMRLSEQYSRNRNIEISGLEYQQGENLLEVLEKIAGRIRVPYSENDVDVVHRLPSKRETEFPRVVVQFTSRKVRNKWLKNKKNDRIMSKEVTGGYSDNMVYLNTHLTNEWKDLLWKARQHGKPKGYLAIWFRDNKILAKRNFADKDAIIITKEEDIQLLR